MPIAINPIKRAIVKRELKKGNSGMKAMLMAGYKRNTAKNAYNKRVVKEGKAKILKEFDKSKITVEYILEEFEKAKDLCLQAGDRTNLLRVLESLGRHLAMFTDKTEVKDTSKDHFWDEFQQNRDNRVKELIDET